MSQTPEQILASLSSMMGAGSPLFRDTSLMAKVLAEAAKNQTKLNGLSDKEIKLIEEKLKADDEYAVKVRQRAQSIEQGAKMLGTTAAKTAIDMGGLASKVAASADGFTAIIPVVQMMANTTKGVIEALAKITTGWSVLGISISKTGEGFSQLAGIGIDLVTNALVQQIEGSQRIVNSYVLMSKAGVTFGGSLEDMKAAAHSSGMSIDTFGKFITKNYEQFGSLTGNVTEAATKVGAMSKNISTTNPKILAMYGSMEELGNATADYMSMQARYGVDTTKNTKDLTVGATEYLIAQKELTALTGKSSDTLKKAEEERANSAAYQMAMSKMSTQEQLNTQKAIELITVRYGTEAGKIATESVARNGEIISQSALTMQARLPGMVDTIQVMLKQAIGKDAKQFNMSSAQLIQERQPLIKAEVDSWSETLKLQAAGVLPAIDGVNSAAAAIYRTQGAQVNAVKTATQMEEDRKKGLKEGAGVFASVITELEGFKIKMDTVFMDNLLKPEFAESMKALYELGAKSVGFLDQLSTVMPKVLSGFNRALEELEKLKTGSAPPATPSTSTGMDMGGAEIATAGQAQLTSAERANTGQAQLASQMMYQLTTEAMKTGMANYKSGGGHGADTGLNGIDCSGWILHLNRAMMKKVNEEAGKPVYSEQVMSIFKAGAAGDIVSNLRKAGAAVITKSLNDLTPDDLKSGMILGQRTGAKDKESGRTDHITQVVTGPDGKLYISESGSGKGVHLTPIEDWKKFYQKLNPEMDLVDTAGLAKFAKGGIANSPSIAGESGPEAIVPLSDGRSIPVKMDVGELVDKIEEMISVMKDQLNVSENILQATA
jgi:hypothetical protein